MKIDVFFRTYNKDKAKMLSESNKRELKTEIADADAGDIDKLLAAAWKAGAGKGNSHSGVYEIQTDHGVWDSIDGRKINVDTDTGRTRIRFRTWAELETEVAA